MIGILMGRIRISFILFFVFLSTNLFAESLLDVYCPKCSKYLFSIERKTNLTLPDADGHSLICPVDGTPLNGYEYWAWERNMDAPKMVYPALTVWTKGNDGFYWFPYEVDISNK